jgi:hypothetical protein
MNALKTVSTYDLLADFRVNQNGRSTFREWIFRQHFTVSETNADLYGYLESRAHDILHSLIDIMWTATCTLYLYTLDNSDVEHYQRDFLMSFAREIRFGLVVHLNILRLIKEAHLEVLQLKVLPTNVILALQGEISADILWVFNRLLGRELASVPVPVPNTASSHAHPAADRRWLYISGWAWRNIYEQLRKESKRKSTNPKWASRLTFVQMICQFTGRMTIAERAAADSVDEAFRRENRGGLVFTAIALHSFCRQTFMLIQRVATTSNLNLYAERFPQFTEETVLQDSGLKKEWTLAILNIFGIGLSETNGIDEIESLLNHQLVLRGWDDDDSTYLRAGFEKKVVHCITGEILRQQNNGAKTLETESKQRDMVKFKSMKKSVKK